MMSAKIKIFDEEHEKDLEEAVNGFLEDIAIDNLIDIQYQLSHFSDGPGQIYSYSAMILYNDKDGE